MNYDSSESVTGLFDFNKPLFKLLSTLLNIILIKVLLLFVVYFEN